MSPSASPATAVPLAELTTSANRINAACETVIEGKADVVLLDNMNDLQITQAVKRAKGRVQLEVSGGVTLDTVRSYADAGADLISTSVITQSAPALDLAFDLGNDPRPKER